jgi:putative zinc finger protein
MTELQLQLGGHERFVELCALYPTGGLSEAELAELRQHVETCKDCRSLLAEYRRLNQAVLPLAVNGVAANSISTPRWDPEDAKRRLFAAIDGSEDAVVIPQVDSASSSAWTRLVSRFPAPIGVLGVAALITIVAAAGVSYFAGFRKGSERSARGATAAWGQGDVASRVPGLQTEQRSLDDRIRERDASIQTLSAKITQQSSEIARLTELLTHTAADDEQARSQLSAAQANQTTAVADHNALQSQLNDAQGALTTLQGQLRQTLDQRTSDLMQSATLQERMNQVNAELTGKDSQIEEQKTLLSSDRDIRELMGARDLFIADVFDIARDGTTKKPFGRVFYTKNKSLVFYAFDLDKQQDVRGKQEVTFQAWGLNDANKHSPLNLGIFYMDNQTNRRWVLKFDDPDVLQRINAVFVTVEPSGGSSKPSGKQLLYAYLEAQANHP